MPFNEALTTLCEAPAVTVTTSDWQRRLPVLSGGNVTLRELRLSDAPSLHALLNTDEVKRFISPPPTTVEGFERFIRWTTVQQRAGRYACFAVVPQGMTHAVGLFQVRQLDSSFETAEWGFAIGSAYWGSGLFAAGARLVLDFAFAELGVHRLEARAAISNGRGNGALRKLGAVPEAILRHSFVRNGEALDQQLWSILADDWQALSLREQLPTIH